MAYEEFVREQDKLNRIPFLIPEFRFQGSTGFHKYRLDFTILSASRNLKLGIELSPWSTHGRVRSKKKLKAAGGEAVIEKERIKKWEAESNKRNDYFEKFGITTITFTDSNLRDIKACFKQVEKFLLPPKEHQIALPEATSDVEAYCFDEKKKIEIT